jgi:hypothetical protein
MRNESLKVVTQSRKPLTHVVPMSARPKNASAVRALQVFFIGIGQSKAEPGACSAAEREARSALQSAPR